jgi:hypothetical protein
MLDDDIYGGEKCSYTGLPIFMGCCDCYIHRIHRQRFDRVEPPVNTMKKSRSHEILQIEPPVTEDDIKKAYRRLCLVHHPDKGGSNDEFIKINNAYNELLVCC